MTTTYFDSIIIKIYTEKISHIPMTTVAVLGETNIQDAKKQNKEKQNLNVHNPYF